MEVQCKRFSGNGLSTAIPECERQQSELNALLIRE